MLKKSLIIVFIGFISLYGTVFSKKATVTPKLLQQENGNQWCPVSGEKIEDFYKTSYTAKLQMNENNRQYCSIRCLVMDMDEYGIDLNSVQVLDVISQKYIQAQDAYFVVGSEVDGSLSQKSKLAFKSKKDALEFIKKYKGTIKSFKETLKLARNSLKKDNEILKKIKKKKTYPRGKRIFEKVCQKDLIDPTSYIEINELKQDIVDKKLCKPLKEKDLQAVALYIWEVKRFGDLDTIEDKVQVKEDEKCPVCDMYTYKYPRWAVQIFYEKQDDKKHWSFDGVKDMMKFYFDSQKWVNY